MPTETAAQSQGTGVDDSSVAVDSEAIRRRARRVGLEVALEIERGELPVSDGGLSAPAEAWQTSVEGASAEAAARVGQAQEICRLVEERLRLPERGRVVSQENLDRSVLVNEARHACHAYLRLVKGDQ